MPKSSGRAASRALAALPAAALLAYGVAFAATALGRRVPAFDDHPGQLYRLWHVVTFGPAPWAWNPGWWTGYPELQFYPPAFAYAGALLHGLSFGALSVPAAYVALLWLAYLAPGFATLFALTRVLGSVWLALPGAFVALTLTLWPAMMSGVDGGVHVGMAPARLGWAMLPLLLGVLAPWADGSAPFPARAVVPLAALIVLTHPAHVPAAVALVLLAALLAPPRARRLAAALGWLGVGALVTAFWTLPLLARLGETRALAWGRLTEVPAGWPFMVVVALLALRGVLAAWVSRAGRVWLLAAFPWVAGLVVALDAFLLEPLGLRWLPADRLMDAVWLGLVMAAALGAVWIDGAWPGWLARHVDVRLAVTGALLILLVAIPNPALMLWPRAAAWPAYAPTVRGLRMEALWRTLKDAPPGRVLFVRSGVPLVYGPEWWRPHTHLTALTPRESGREIVNGTFTHPSPIAALVYRGSAERGAITQLVERLDGQSLFGRPLESLDAATLNDHARRLRVSVIVALEDDLPRLPALADNPAFPTRRAQPPFVMWLGPPALLPQPAGEGRWRVPPDQDGQPGEWTSAGLAYYPLWRASAIGRPLETRRGTAGDLEVRAPASGAVELTYGPGVPELAGLAVTVLGVLLWLVGPRYFTAAAPASEHS